MPTAPTAIACAHATLRAAARTRPPRPCPVPTGLYVTYNPDTSPKPMNFSWNASAGATTYQLSGGSISYSGSATTYQTALNNPTQSQYSVRACNVNGCSAWSTSVKALPMLLRKAP